LGRSSHHDADDLSHHRTGEDAARLWSWEILVYLADEDW
jgi:hypothetical protein